MKVTAGDNDIGLRILEIGRACLLKWTWPDSVTWVCPGGRPARAAILVRVPLFEATGLPSRRPQPGKSG